MAGKFSDFFGFHRSKKRDEQSQQHASYVTDPTKESKRFYKGISQPMRQLILWGWDSEHNPGYLILYGEHKFKKNNKQGELEDDVSYTHYYIARGKEGHFPSFESVKISDYYDYKQRKPIKNMYYKKDLRQRWYNSEGISPVEDYKVLKDPVIIPYFLQIPYKEQVKMVEAKNSFFHNFRISDTKEAVLPIPRSLEQYRENIYTVLSHPSLYMRKKHLKMILSSNPPKEIYGMLVQVGSGELISGLFLDLALQNNNTLVETAEGMLRSNIEWLSESYAKGLKRCASLYNNCFNAAIQEKRIQWIQAHQSEMDLKILYINEKGIPADKLLEGIDYQKYANQGYLAEYRGYYVRENGKYKYKRERRKKIFEKNTFNDGVSLNINLFKNTIQEAEIFGLSDIIGTVAYYCDAPRLTSYFSGNSNTKTLRYFKRYLRRILEGYAQTDENKYIEAMKILFTKYTEGDYLSRHKGNFQQNYFIKFFLYHDYNETRPNGWKEGYEWVRNDQLMKLEGRYEYRKDIWNRHLDAVVYILGKAKISVVLKAFYCILKEADGSKAYLQQLSYQHLIALSNTIFAPVAELAVEAISNKLAAEAVFDSEIMVHLMNASNKQIHAAAFVYFERTNGKFSPESLIEMLFMDNFDTWIALFEKNVEKLDADEYLVFLQSFIKLSDRFAKENKEYSDEIIELFDKILDKMHIISFEQRTELISIVLSTLTNLKNQTRFLFDFLEKMLFSSTLEEMQRTLENVTITQAQSSILNRSRLIFDFLTSLKNQTIPTDNTILEILEVSTSKMIKLLVDVISEKREQLKDRRSTLLILAESQVVALNEIAKDVFNQLQGDAQKTMLLILIDSPDPKTYDFAIDKLYEIYEQSDTYIPQDFIVQMFQHTSTKVRAFITDKIFQVIRNLGNGDSELFLYYAKTLLLLPNKASDGKKNIYENLPVFVQQYKEKQAEVEAILLEIGGSNIILDSERALVTLAKIRKETV